MKIILKGGTVIDVDLDKSTLFVNSERVVIYNIGINAFPYHASDACEEKFCCSIDLLEKIEVCKK